MRHVHLHRHVVVVWILILAAVALVAKNPRLLAPATTRVLNRLLLAGDQGELKVRAYHLRPGVGVDLYDVSLTLVSDGGDLSLIAADTLELDYRTAEILGRTVRLRRAVARGLEVYTRSALRMTRRRNPAARRSCRACAPTSWRSPAPGSRWPGTTAARRRPCRR